MLERFGLVGCDGLSSPKPQREGAKGQRVFGRVPGEFWVETEQLADGRFGFLAGDGLGGPDTLEHLQRGGAQLARACAQERQQAGGKHGIAIVGQRLGSGVHAASILSGSAKGSRCSRAWICTSISWIAARLDHCEGVAMQWRNWNAKGQYLATKSRLTS